MTIRLLPCSCCLLLRVYCFIWLYFFGCGRRSHESVRGLLEASKKGRPACVARGLSRPDNRLPRLWLV